MNLSPLVERLRAAIGEARSIGEIHRNDKARALWHGIYAQLSEGKPGLAGALTARSEAQTMRLACLYALLDSTGIIREEHLLAALEMWRYCERSVRFVFGESLGDDVADEILGALRQRHQGMTRNEIRGLVGTHQSANRIAQALALLQRFSLANFQAVDTGGRPAERWFYGDGHGRKAI